MLEVSCLYFFFSGCFLFPSTPSKSQLHKLSESCILNMSGCGLATPTTAVIAVVNTPEINIQGNNIDYPNNGTFNFGTVAITDPPVNAVFTIQNLGQASLTLSSGTIQNMGQTRLSLAVIPASIVVVSGTDAALFSIIQPTVTSISAGASTTFTITFAPVLTGTKTASISIANDDADENPYIINLQGIGGPGK